MASNGKNTAQQYNPDCPIAGFLDIFGDGWTWLIMRETFIGSTRFTQIQRSTGIAKNLLSDRLTKLVAEGILNRIDIGENGSRFEYRLTPKGQSLAPVLVNMVQWSNEHIFGAGKESLLLVEEKTGTELKKMEIQSVTGAKLNWTDLSIKAGPGVSNSD